MSKEDMMLSDFPVITFDKIRYSDTDRQGHVNNAAFSTFLETGRTEILYSRELPVLSENSSFVIASLKLDFLIEIEWPGQTDIGTGILRIGNSSVTFFQKLFQNGICAATAETVIVQVRNDKSGSQPLSEEAKDILGRYMLSSPPDAIR